MLKNKALGLAAVTGLALGGLSIGSVAAAQSYGEEPATSVEESTETEAAGESLEDDGITLVQDDAEADAEAEAGTDAEAEAETDGEDDNSGRRGHDKDCDGDDAGSADAEATVAT